MAAHLTTRTVAIIKTHALPHRFDIEHRILEASFEVGLLSNFHSSSGLNLALRFQIVKERQIEFDTDSDPDFLDELFGEDAASLAE